MILSDGSIKTMLQRGELKVSPLTEESIQPASIDLRLGSHYLAVESSTMDCITLSEKINYRELKGETLIIPPHSFLLATTMESVSLPNNMTAFVEGRSSIGRIGLFIQNAGWVDPGFRGQITLELYNANALPIKLQSGRRICQLVLCRMDQATLRPYKGKYQEQSLSTGSLVFKDSETKAKTPKAQPKAQGGLRQQKS